MIEVYAANMEENGWPESERHVVPFFRKICEKTGRHGGASIVYGAYGKPFLSGEAPLFFNGSHSGDYLVCALSIKPVGVDVQLCGQQTKKKRNILGIARRYMTENEYRWLESLTKNQQEKAFYHLWAQKESYMKYVGRGFSLPLNDFEILSEKKPVEVLEKGIPQKGVYFHDVFCHRDYELVVCGEEEKVRLIRYEEL